MKAKILSSLMLSILVLVLFAGFASALTLSPSPSSISLSTVGSTATLSIINSDTDGTFSILTYDGSVTITDADSNQVVFTIVNLTSLTDVSEPSFNINLSSVDEDFAVGTHSGTLSIYGENVSNSTFNHTLDYKLYYDNSELCEYNNLGSNLDLEIDKISVEEGFGDDEDYWYPLDEIEIEIDIENKGTEDIDDIEIEWGLYDTKAGKWLIDDKENEFDLKDDDTESIYITFKLDDVDDFENGGEYVFYVWATGKDGEFDKNKTCESVSQEIEIEIEDDFVVLDNIRYPSTAQCGEEVQILADVWNIGDDDQDDVEVFIYNKALGLGEWVSMGDVDKFDEADTLLDYIFKVPSDAEEKTHNIELTVYDDRGDVYENNDDDESSFVIGLAVSGGCTTITPTGATVSASLESDAKAGQDLTVKATITNPTDETVTYTVKVTGYSDWADSVDVEQIEMIFSAGESRDMTFTFDVMKSASGDKTFSIELVSEGVTVLTQPVSGFSIEGEEVGWKFSKENWYLWVMGILIIILIILIIIVSVRLAKK